MAPRELDRLAEYGLKIRDEYVGVGASGQIFTAHDLKTGKDVAIKIVRGVYSHPRVAQNLWREVNDREAHFMLLVRVGPKQHVTVTTETVRPILC